MTKATLGKSFVYAAAVFNLIVVGLYFIRGQMVKIVSECVMLASVSYFMWLKAVQSLLHL